jgi:hypothetical protein
MAAATRLWSVTRHANPAEASAPALTSATAARYPDRVKPRQGFVLGHAWRMATWNDFEREEPAFAAKVRALFDARKHKTLATLRADGSPRISGIEVEFTDGELTFGSMPDARKGTDLLRDPRFALHGPSVDPPEGNPSGWPGEAKVAGRAILVGDLDGEAAGQLFRAELDEVVLTQLNEAGDRLRIEVWRPGVPLRRIERE